MNCTEKDSIQRTQSLLTTLEEKSYPFTSCGPWTSQLDEMYTREFEQRPKMIFVPHVSGLSDRFVGLATIFLLSLITNRLFLLGNMPELHPLDSPFEPRHQNILTNIPTHLISSLRENKTYPYGYMFIDPYSPSTLVVNAIGDGEFLLSKETIQILSNLNYTDIYIVSNRGRTISMFDKSYMKKKLSSLGLTKNSAFGCAIRYLFRPRPEVFLPLLPTLEVLAQPNTLKIAIHIRTHDGVLVYGNKIIFEKYLSYFNCAEQIHSFGLQNNQKVIWILYTDSIELRYAVFNKYGRHKVHVAMDVPVEHSAKEMICPFQTCVTKTGFDIAAAEWWNLGLADYHVVGIQGGYGKSAVMRTGRLNSTFLIYPEVSHSSCSKSKTAKTSEIKLAYAGI